MSDLLIERLRADEWGRYARKAVELADGWEYVDNGKHPPYVALLFADPNSTIFEWFYQWPLKQIGLDALAAQLERQYLAAVEMPTHITYMTEMRRQPIGTDLTMWRITYIVESGVLEGEK